MSNDIIFLHAPNLSNFYLPLGRFINNNYIPMGTIALANMVEAEGYKTKLIHMGVELLLDKSFSVVDYVSKHKVKMVGLNLFWFHQSFDVIDLAQKIKKYAPETFVFIGGLTASYYADEIMNEYQQIDAVVCGYGEVGIKDLCNYVIKKEGELSKINNLVYRNGGEIVRTPVVEVDAVTISELDYSNLSLLRNYEVYAEYFGLHEMPLNLSESKGKIMNETIITKMFPLAIGRGCDTVCSYCGGNKVICKRLYGVNFMVWREIEQVIVDIEKVQQYGYNKIFICFDPNDDNDNYYIRLFREIKNRDIRISLYFECWKLPDKEFLDAFSETFPDEHSHILLSIDSINEVTRGGNRSNQFNNKEMLEAFEYCDRKKIRIDLCFSLALPRSSYQEDFLTYEFMKDALQNYKMIGRVNTFLIDLVPGSPMYENPEKFDVEVTYHSFKDYYQAFKDPLHSTYALCNYKLKNYFGDERDNGTVEEFSKYVQNMKCQYFCGINDKHTDHIMECCHQRKEVYKELRFDIDAQPFDIKYTYQDELRIIKNKVIVERYEYI